MGTSKERVDVFCFRSPWGRRSGLILSVVSVLTTSAYADHIAEGRVYFTRYCASCYGPVADGHGEDRSDRLEWRLLL